MTPEGKQQLLDYIHDVNKAKELLTTNMISLKATDIYYSTEHIATKAAMNHFYSHGLNMFSSKKGQYTQDFIDLFSNILPLAIDDPNSVVNTYNIESFHASSSWVHNFMKENNLSFRKFHKKKRGDVDPEKVEQFLDSLAEAIRNFGPNKVFNMDETFIKLDNSQVYTIIDKGADEVTVEGDYNDEKAGTTYMATISANPEKRYPLVLIAKGTTGTCEKKYGNVRDVFALHTESGWSVPSIIKAYLNLLIEWCKPPCALILDVFAAHRERTVQEYAHELGIKLIFVPACGIGTYQPLDRVIFGIFKKELSRMQRNNPISVDKHTQKYEVINKRASQIMGRISNRAIEAAWEIPGLESRLHP